MTNRQPPYSEEAEKAVLGSILLDVLRAWPLVDRAGLSETSFYVPLHRAIFGAMTEIVALREGWKGMMGVDAVTVSEKLKAGPTSAQVDGLGVLNGILDSTPTAAHAEYYIDILRQHEVRRGIIKKARELEAEAYVMEVGEKLLADIPDRFAEITVKRDEGETNREALKRIVQRYKTAARGEESAMGLEVPWTLLNEMICGLELGVTLLAGRPSAGKTTMEDCISTHLASLGIPVGRVTLDGSREELMARALSRKAGVSMYKLKGGFVKEGSDQDLQVDESAEILGAYPMYITETARDIKDIISQARYWVAKHDIKLLTLDYIQQVNASEMGRSQWDTTGKVTHCSSAMKALSLELKIPVLVLCQLSRSVEKEGRTPQLSDLRDSGGLEQDAHKVIFLYPDVSTMKEMEERDEKRSWKKRKPVWVDVMKQKDGETGRLPYILRGPYYEFEEGPAGVGFEEMMTGGLL